MESLELWTVVFLDAGLETCLFNVVDLPEEGLPTRPIRGSRGMLWKVGGKIEEAKAGSKCEVEKNSECEQICGGGGRAGYSRIRTPPTRLMPGVR